MAAWDKTSVVEWFKAHGHEEIVIRMAGTALRVQGRTHGIEEVDACSLDYQETALRTGGEDLEIALSFHEATLAIHLVVYHPGTRDVAVSLPASIPFERLELATAAEAARKGQAEEEPISSPYELLH